jgi:glycerol uptake operon antiterminator
VAQHTGADGIITTRPQLARRAKALGLISLQRFFLLDSMAVDNLRRQMEQDGCDLIEVLPGVMPKIINRIMGFVRKPIIAGGLICDKEDVTSALAAGAVAVSSTSPVVWFL